MYCVIFILAVVVVVVVVSVYVYVHGISSVAIGFKSKTHSAGLALCLKPMYLDRVIYGSWMFLLQ